MRPWNPWLDELHFRKGLVLVCKTWSWSATAFLYEDIVLSRMGQIPALAQTLSSGGTRNLCGLVQHLRLDGCVVWAPCTTVVREDLLTILRRCVALRTLSFHPHPNFPYANRPDDVHNGWQGYNPTWFVHDHADDFGLAFQVHLSSWLRELDVAIVLTETQVVELHKLLSSAKNLCSLKIGSVKEPGDLQSSIPALRPLCLPVLTEFQLHATHPTFITLVCSRWVMPALKGLTVLNCFVLPEELLKSHGRSLTYLNICPSRKTGVYDYSWEPCVVKSLEDLRESCPVLEHLVFPAHTPTFTAADILDTIRSPTLRYLDIWCHQCFASRARIERELQCIVDSGQTPALIRIRRLQRVVHPDLPVICHPSLVSGDEERVYRFPRAHFLQTSYAVIPDCGPHSDMPCFVQLSGDDGDDGDDDATYIDSSENEDDEDNEDNDEDETSSPASDDTPYDPFNDESDSDSSTSSDDDDDSVSDPYSDAEISEWEFNSTLQREELLSAQHDRTTVLDIFRSTQVSDSEDSGDLQGDMSVDDD